MHLDLQLNELQVGDSFVVFNSAGTPVIHFNSATSHMRVLLGTDRSRVVAFCQRHKLEAASVHIQTVNESHFYNLFLFIK